MIVAVADEPCLIAVDSPTETEVFPLVYPRLSKEKHWQQSKQGKFHRFTRSRFSSGVDVDESLPDSGSCEAMLAVE